MLLGFLRVIYIPCPSEHEEHVGFMENTHSISGDKLGVLENHGFPGSTLFVAAPFCIYIMHAHILYTNGKVLKYAALRMNLNRD